MSHIAICDACGAEARASIGPHRHLILPDPWYAQQRNEGTVVACSMRCFERGVACGGNQAVGASVCGSLRKRGLVSNMPHAGWRTTEAGRALLSEVKERS